MCEKHSNRRDEIRSKLMSNVRIEDGPLETPCWVWTAGTSGDGRGGGYSRLTLDGATVAGHRTSWTNEYGMIPPKKQLDHLCKNRLCINHDHLEMVTHKQNQRRRRQG